MIRKKVLYVEDQATYHGVVRRNLEEEGIQVVIEDTWSGGRAALEREKPDLLLLDVELPDGNGFEICEGLRQEQRFQDLPIMMLTIRGELSEWCRGLASGANDYLDKPFNPKKLVERVRECLAGKFIAASCKGTPQFRLAQTVLHGNDRAFGVLWEMYFEPIFNAARSWGAKPLEAEDVADRTFIKALEHLGAFRGESDFGTWLYRIAINVWKHDLRGRKNNQDIHERIDEAADPHQLPFELQEPDHLMDLLENRIRDQRIDVVLKKLSPLDRQILDLYYFDALKCDQIAEDLNVPIGTVLRRLSDGRKHFRAAWENFGKDN